MLETRNTFSEQLIQKIKKDREKNRIDYVHPRNQIQDGFIVVNYQKRNIVYKDLLDGKMIVPMLEEWNILQRQENLYIYGFAKEKELLAFKITEDTLADVMKQDWNKRDNQYVKEEILKTKTGLLIDCKMFMMENNTFVVVFAIPYNNAWIQGTFMAHSFRKKVWKQVMPQMIQAIEIKEMEISQQGKENGDEYTLS